MHCCAAFGWGEACLAQQQQPIVYLTPEQQSGVTALAQMIQKELKKEKCANSTCQVLVVSLTVSTGATCSACILISEALTKSLAELPDPPGVIKRAQFASFMDQERIPSIYLDLHETLVWIGRELGASRVVFGSLVFKGDSLQLKTKVLKHESFGNSTEISKEMNVKVPLGDLSAGLEPRESFHSLVKPTSSLVRGSDPIEVSGKTPGVSLPSCFYMPNPPYTDAARSAKLSGTVLVEAMISREGEVTDPMIVKGLPFGLNEYTLETLRKWRCKPATRNGEPIPVRIPFEVTFHLD